MIDANEDTNQNEQTDSDTKVEIVELDTAKELLWVALTIIQATLPLVKRCQNWFQ